MFEIFIVVTFVEILTVEIFLQMCVVCGFGVCGMLCVCVYVWCVWCVCVCVREVCVGM